MSAKFLITDSQGKDFNSIHDLSIFKLSGGCFQQKSNKNFNDLLPWETIHQFRTIYLFAVQGWTWVGGLFTIVVIFVVTFFDIFVVIFFVVIVVIFVVIFVR